MSSAVGGSRPPHHLVHVGGSFRQTSMCNFFLGKCRKCERNTNMSECNNLYGSVSFGGGGGGGGETGASPTGSNLSRAQGTSRSNRGRNERSVDNGYGRPAPGDINGNGTGRDEFGLAVAAVGVVSRGPVGVAAGVVGLGIAAGEFAGGFNDRGP